LALQSPAAPTSAPPSSWPADLLADLREMVGEQVQYRELLFALTRRDLLLRYRQTLMGFAWAILMPVTYMLVFSLIFTKVAAGAMKTDGPYPVFAYSGLLPWNFLANSLRFSVGALLANRTLITKVYFPREILPFSVILTSLVDFAVAAIVLAGMLLWYKIHLTSALLFLPVVVLVQIAFVAAVTLLVSLANLFFRDVKYLLEIVITLWMLASPVVYRVERVGGVLGKLLALNPMAPILNAYRSILLHGELPDAGRFAYATVVSIVLLAASWLLFHRSEPRIAEII
jgi:ABC-type polysaccharide/polyol phosphate export permease